MEILNSREIAIGLWLIVIALYIFFSKKMVEVRAAFKQLTFVFRSRPLIMVFFSAILYTAVMGYILSEWDLWNIDQLKNTVFWFTWVRKY